MKAPGPSPLEFSKGIRINTPDFFNELRKKYGDIVRCKLPFLPPMYILSHPDYAKQVLSLQASNYVRQDFVSRRFRSLFGNGSVVAEADLWARQRKIISPVFQRQFLERAVPVLEAQTEAFIRQWEAEARAGRPVPVVESFLKLMLQMLWQVLFNTETKAIEYHLFKTVNKGVNYVASRLPFYYSKWWPTYANWSFFYNDHKLDRILYQMIRSRRPRVGEIDDMLDFLLRYEDPETGQGLSDRLILEEIKTMTPAGYLTTAAGLSWFFYELGKHPEHQPRVNAECQNIQTGTAHIFKRLQQLPHTMNCLFEALRLHPTGWSIWRSAAESGTILGYEIEAGATLISCPYTAHRHPEFWDAPETFNPERNFAEKVDQSYFPFGLGPRKCLGENLAMVEMMIIIPM
ncbi:MAG: cytochrome P450, partial [Phaeodactylibacter sp.]|nr:cytochrome P450 [Phaeodactylibacter sp.]